MSQKNFKFLQRYLANCRRMNRSERTIVNYASDLKRFLRWYETTFPGRALSKADGETVTLYKEWLVAGGEVRPLRVSFWRRTFRRQNPPETALSGEPLSVAAHKRHLSSLRGFFEYLKQIHEDRGTSFRINPVKNKLHAVRLKQADTRPTPMLGQKEWEKLRENTWRPREVLIITLLYHGGLRLAEAANLKVADIDEAAGSLTFERKGGKVQTLFPEGKRELFGQITYWLARRPAASEWLVCDSKGRRLSPRTLHNIVMRLLSRAGVAEVTPHSFRKACATRLYLKSKDLLFVRDYLGHSDAKVTQSYIDVKTLERHRLR